MNNRVTEEKLEIGRRIKALRLARKLDQEALAKRCGLSRAAISTYECGRNCPTVENTVALAEALGVESKEIVPENVREYITEAGIEQRNEAMAQAYARRNMMQRAHRQAQADGIQEKGELQERAQQAQQKRNAWMEEARHAANERSVTGTRTRRKRREPETGATSGFVADAELEDMPEFLRETLIDMHIRRMLWLCGAYGRMGNVKKTRTPLGVAWSAEGETA